MSQSTRVLAELRKLIDREEFVAGERLPPERELATLLSCSRETVRRALAVLESENEVWRHVGQGTFRGGRPAAAPLRDAMIVHATSVEDFVSARCLIEPVVAAEAAQRARRPDIERLKACVAAGRAGKDRFECQKADDVFHRTIAEVAKNPILTSVLSFLSDTRRRSIWQTQWDRTYRHLGMEEFTQRHSDQHSEIVNALEAKDPRAAETQMSEHLETIRVALQSPPGSQKFVSQ